MPDSNPLPDRIAEALLTTRRSDYEGKADHRQHRYDARCALCAYDVDALTNAVLAFLPASVDRAAVLEEGATALEALDPVEAALAGQHAWADAAALLRRLAEAPQPETEKQPGTCTATIPDAFGSAALDRCTALAGHYDESNEPDFTGDNRGPGGWHTNGQEHVWSDRAAAATPHKTQPAETPALHPMECALRLGAERIPDNLASEICEATNNGIPTRWNQFSDRDSDVWHLTDQTHNDDRVMMPSAPDMDLMLRRDVERFFGPLTPEA